MSARKVFLIFLLTVFLTLFGLGMQSVAIGAQNDVDGDGFSDATAIYDYGNASTGFWALFSNGASLQPVNLWSSGLGNWDWSRSKVAFGDYDGDGLSEIAVLYDYGNANTGIWIIRFTGTSFVPIPVWFSGVGNWEWGRSKVVSGDFNGDSKSDIAVLYNYGNANTGIWTFYSDGTGFTPHFMWSSGPGNWEWERSKIASSDFNGDTLSDIAVLYDYDNSSSGLWLFQSTGLSFNPIQGWSSGKGNWDWFRSKLTSGDFNGDGKGDFAVFYDYGNSSSGLWVFYSTGAGVSLAPAWSSGIGNWEWSRTKIVPGDFDGDGKGDIGALYDYGGGNTSIWVFRGSNFPPIPFWSSGPGNWEWSRTRLPGEDIFVRLPAPPPPPPPPTPYQPGWHEVVTFGANGYMTTPIFGVLVSEWRITYTVSGSQYIVFGFFIYDNTGGYVNSYVTDASGTYTTYVHNKAGYFYLDIIAANCNWTVRVEAYY